ncbi:hypothetical protein [Streptomyces sp. TLI_146]|uniref:hypothetical protein n=1 Tax=Streptomyces sp. TLI_146 TaxID=1938858 RepID=UPI000C7028CD|nr:hypothetical protein [Streptomyces sp. TLI_146]PKV87264.1 hypothetical protein BX283_4863 [Streptomyces sp. TLI_146]
MTRSGWTRAALATATAAVVVAGAAGCGGDDEKADGAGGAKKAVAAPQSRTAASQVLAAAYKKTAAAKSAKVRMSMSTPASMGGGAEKTETTGVMAWNPTAMDLTVTSSAAKGMAGAPEKTRMLWVNNVMYVDMGSMGESAKEFGGKRWMKFDMTSLAKQSGKEQLVKQMTAGMENMNQDPAQQLALLLDSPNLKHLGAERIDGVSSEHYKGTLTIDEMMKSNKMLDTLKPEERRQLLTNMKKTGVQGYDTEVWVNADGYPVRMDVNMSSPQGKVVTSTHYSDYGAKAQVTAPPAGETADLMELLKGLGDLAKDGGTGGLGGA